MMTERSLQEGVGLVAINDSFCLEGTIYNLLKKYFRSDTYYVDILELFHQVCHLGDVVFVVVVVVVFAVVVDCCAVVGDLSDRDGSDA